jgi:hypothetical protein
MPGFDGDIQAYAPTEVDEVGQIILKARELLSDPKRWCQGHLRSGGAFCTVGALCEAGGWADGSFMNRTNLGWKTYTRVQAALKQPIPIAHFNDDERTTHADVLALLDRAAKAGG